MWQEMKTCIASAWPWILVLFFVSVGIFAHQADARRWADVHAQQLEVQREQSAALNGIRELLATQGYISRPLVEPSR
jgi:hypothetical protein